MGLFGWIGYLKSGYYYVAGKLLAGAGDVYHTVSKAAGSAINSLANTFIGQFINKILQPSFSVFAYPFVWLSSKALWVIAQFFGLLLGVPMGMARYATSELRPAGIFAPILFSVTFGFIIFIEVAAVIFILKIAKLIYEAF